MRSSRIQWVRIARAGSAIGSYPRAVHSQNPSPVIAWLSIETYLYWWMHKIWMSMRIRRCIHEHEQGTVYHLIETLTWRVGKKFPTPFDRLFLSNQSIIYRNQSIISLPFSPLAPIWTRSTCEEFEYKLQNEPTFGCFHNQRILTRKIYDS